MAEVTIVSEAEAAAPAETQAPATGFLVPGAKGTSTGFMAPDAATGGSSADDGTAAAMPQAPERKMMPVVVDVDMGSGTAWIEPYRVTLERGGETLVVTAGTDEIVRAEGRLPDWAVQRREGGKIIAYFGFDGRIEIEEDEVKVRQRFPGLGKLRFRSFLAILGLSLGETLSLMVSGERIKPDQSNLSLAVDNFLNNAEWQHADVFIKLGQTIVMAFVGTLFATAIAFPLSFMAARNITPSFLTNQIVKRLFDFLRSVDMLIWALFFTRAFGPGRWPVFPPSFSPTQERSASSMPKRWKTSTRNSARVCVRWAPIRCWCRGSVWCRRCCRCLSASRCISGNPTQAIGNDHRRSGCGRYRAQALGSDADKCRLGKRGLYGAADPVCRVCV
jgi:phosphonate transport system permease protein